MKTDDERIAPYADATRCRERKDSLEQKKKPGILYRAPNL